MSFKRTNNDEIELKLLQRIESCDNKSVKDEKKEKSVNFSSEVQVADDVTQKPQKTVQFSKPQVSFEEHSNVEIEIKANLIPNRKREEEQVMENLRRHVGDILLDKNWKQKLPTAPSKVLEEKSEFDDHGTQPLLAKVKQPEPQTTDNDFLVDCLCWQNEFRARHNVPAMNLSKKLCVSAQEWANHLASRNEVYYCPPSIFNFGQSIFCCAETALMISISGQEVATYWYSSMKRYDFSKPPSLLHTNVNSGHFSQIVWKNTKFLGVGKSTAKSGKIYVVAYYYPPGNIAGEFHENVFPPVEQMMRPESANSNNANN